MPHVHRFYAAPEAGNPDIAILRDDEAHHAIHAVRLRAGDAVEIFDGIGRSWTGKVASMSRSEVTLNVSDERLEPIPSTEFTLALGWLHRDKAVEEVVRRCTELGVSQFVFFRAERSERAPKLSYKLARQAIESCKQCCRNRLPGVATAPSLNGVLSQAEGALLLATKDLAPVPLATGLAGSSKVVLFVGPEGDFTGDELRQILDAGGAPISLGERTLRSEVAAVTGCTLALYELGQLGPRQT
jgi:16S rRNA (uracil1498-N3)-methyltransferase